ncbi:MAG: galactose oxidase, partial [Planctomycetes bacterium]|nr:galactose oxidase [Planctomycetota bacterium]
MQSDARQTDANSSQFELKWDNLPSIPDSQGFAGMYAGVSNDVLVVAGGANFPRGFPWEGGTKAFYDSIFVLDR